MRNLISFFVLFVLAVFAFKYGRAERGLDFPIHDGKNRVINLSKKNFNRFLKKFDILVVYFTIPHDPNDHFATKQWELTEEMLELAAQITEREGVGFGVVDLEKDQKLAAKLNIFEAGSIYVYKSGHRVEYDGQRSTDVLVEFLLELDEYPVEEIGSKTEVAGFKKNDLTKVIGYFENPSSDGYDEFVDAALDFQPMIPFFAVFNKQIAKQLGLHELNQVDFYEPYMRKATTIPGDHPLDNTVIEKYVNDHKRATLRKLRPMDMYDVWEMNRKSGNNQEDEINDIHVVMFADDEDPEGFELSNNIKEVSQKNTDNAKLSIVWIDPDDFPLLHDYWESTFGVNLAEPQIGVVNVTDADSIWMEFKKSRLPTVEELDKWVNDVMSGKINTEDDDDDYNLEDDDEEDDEDDDGDAGNGNVDDDDDEDDDDKTEL